MSPSLILFARKDPERPTPHFELLSLFFAKCNMETRWPTWIVGGHTPLQNSLSYIWYNGTFAMKPYVVGHEMLQAINRCWPLTGPVQHSFKWKQEHSKIHFFALSPSPDHTCFTPKFIPETPGLFETSTATDIVRMVVKLYVKMCTRRAYWTYNWWVVQNLCNIIALMTSLFPLVRVKTGDTVSICGSTQDH